MLCLVKDNDSNWYVIKEEQKGQFCQWVNAYDSDLPFMYDFDLCRINSPFQIRFESFKELTNESN